MSSREHKILKMAHRASAEALAKQTQDGLYKVFKVLKCGGVAKEIKAGRNVSGNAAYGFRMCVHSRLGPTVNVDTWKFNPMTKRAKEIEQGFVKNINGMLKNGGFKTLPPDIISKLRAKDKSFEQKMKKRRAERKK